MFFIAKYSAALLKFYILKEMELVVWYMVMVGDGRGFGDLLTHIKLDSHIPV